MHPLTILVLVVLGAGPFGLVPRALATPNHAHHHYHMGIRAYAGSKHAAMLHHEAAAPGCDLVLARDNALAMEALAHELVDRAERLVEVMSDEENAAIGGEVALMRFTALELRAGSAELGQWLDQALLAAADGTLDEAARSALQARIVDRTRVLHTGFKRVLGAHKTAEAALGIPVPPEPEPTASS
jgi:hypothetical protein